MVEKKRNVEQVGKGVVGVVGVWGFGGLGVELDLICTQPTCLSRHSLSVGDRVQTPEMHFYGWVKHPRPALFQHAVTKPCVGRGKCAWLSLALKPPTDRD